MKSERAFGNEEQKIQENPIHERLDREEQPQEHYKAPEELYAVAREEDDVVALEESEKRHKEKRGDAFVPTEEIPDELSFGLGEKLLEKIDAGINGEASDEVVGMLRRGEISIDESVLEDLIALGAIGEEEARRTHAERDKDIGPKPKLPTVLWKKVREFSLPAPEWNKLLPEEQERRKSEVRKAKREYFDNKLKNVMERARGGLSPREWDRLPAKERGKRLQDARNFFE